MSHGLLRRGSIAALLQVIMIDLVLAGDNAVVIGLAAAGLRRTKRRGRAILVGTVIAATVFLLLRLTVFAVQLLGIYWFAAGGRHPAAAGCLEDVAAQLRGTARPETGCGHGGRAPPCPAQDLRPGRLADRGRRRARCLARQRAAGSGRRARPHRGARRSGWRDPSGRWAWRQASSPGCSTGSAGSPMSGLAIILYVALRHDLARRSRSVAAFVRFSASNILPLDSRASDGNPWREPKLRQSASLGPRFRGDERLVMAENP